jgi:hypothetical protein
VTTGVTNLLTYVCLQAGRRHVHHGKDSHSSSCTGNGCLCKLHAFHTGVGGATRSIFTSAAATQDFGTVSLAQAGALAVPQAGAVAVPQAGAIAVPQAHPLPQAGALTQEEVAASPEGRAQEEVAASLKEEVAAASVPSGGLHGKVHSRRPARMRL